MILIRYLLIIIIGYLVARSFINFGRKEIPHLKEVLKRIKLLRKKYRRK